MAYKEVQELAIFSIGRISGNSSNFKIVLPVAIPEVKKVDLLYVGMFNTFFNVITGYNDAITFTDGSGAHTFTIPAGAYDIVTFMSTVGTGMTTASGSDTYTLAQSSTTLKITITDATGNFSIVWGSTSANYLLGFSTTTISGTTTYTADNMPNLLPFPICYINISEIGPSGFNASIPNDKLTFSLPINVNTGQLIEYKENTHYKQSIPLSGITLSTLSVFLMTYNGNGLSLNGSEWTMIIKYYR